MKRLRVGTPTRTVIPILLPWLAAAAAALSCSPASILGPTPTPTATVTPTPSSTPTPTRTPTPSSTPTVSGAGESLELLVLEDLPSGFEAVPPEEFGLVEGEEFAEGYTIGSPFAFIEPNRFEVIFGFTMGLERRLDQIGFDTGLDRPEVLIEGMAAGLGETGYENVTVLEGMELIGDKSNGLGLVLISDPLAFQLDMVIFRKGSLGVFLCLMYFEGEQPLSSIQELAETMEQRVPPEKE